MTALSMCWMPMREIMRVAFPSHDQGNGSGLLVARWGVHVLLWVGLLTALWYINRTSGMERFLQSPWPSLHRIWLPFLAVGVYALGWLSRGLWLSFEISPLPTVGPAMVSAWAQVRPALDQGTIEFQQAPIFLILGPRAGATRAWLDAIGTTPLACHSATPFCAFANSDAIFIVCDQISMLGKLGQQSPGAEDEMAERLGYLCACLEAERSTRLPIQGVMLIVPPTALQSEKGTRETIHAMQSDLDVIRAATGLNLPLYLAMNSPHGLPSDMAAPTWFQRFPPYPDVDPAELASMFEDGMNWLFSQQIPADLRTRFRLDTAPTEQGILSSTMRDNLQLFQRLCEFHAQRLPLMKCLLQGTQADEAEPGMVAGFYFLSAVPLALAQDMLTHQHAAAWTPEALADPSSLRR